MRITVLGGGPAGLYAAILLRKRTPAHDVRVLERNGPDDTFGWGVVFSEETLGNLGDADRPSFDAITKSFVRWTDIDIFDRGEMLRSTGHTFAGVSRKHLLNILQARAGELGTEITYRADVADPWKLAAESDLLIAADGANSATRSARAKDFGTKIDTRRCRYIWLGTDRKFDAFSFFFRENEHGLFQVHAYPFTEARGTFIVECDEAVFRHAGLDKASEDESIAYCEKLFAEDLRGARLFGNRSRWLQFPTITNATWMLGNVVLLGDAAHTAHFSIGSGTKLALEDSIALVDALATTSSVSAALATYDNARRPVVERTQRAAQDSLEWFENVPRYRQHEPLQFAFSLLTRSRRISHANLRLRDGALVDRVDRWFETKATHRVSPADRAPTPPMFTPLKLRELELLNRVVVSPMCMYSAVDGTPQEFHFMHLAERAYGGAGLVMAEMTNVSPEGRITLGCTGLYEQGHVGAWKRIVDFVHRETTSKIGIQLGHAGRKASVVLPWEGQDVPLDDARGWELLAPSAIPYDPKKSRAPRAVTRADMDRLRDAYVRAAKNANDAGFDLLELHAAHGYLLSTFLTPLANHRTDEYGGSLENRMRFVLEIFDAVRAAWPSHKPMSTRISAVDWVDGGFTLDDAVVVSRALKDHGCDIIDVSSGQTHPDAKPRYGRMWQTPFSDRIRNEVGVKTITVGAITSPDEINSILVAGRADLCALARPHLRNPHFTIEAAAQLGYDAWPWPKQYFLGRPPPPRAPLR